jgi:hypothetical protein
MYSIYQFDKKSRELIKIPATPENIKEVILPPPGVVGFSNLFEHPPTKGYSVIPTQPTSNVTLHRLLSELLGLRMAFPLQGNIIYAEKDTSEVEAFLNYLCQTGIIQNRASSLSLKVKDPLDIEAIAATVKAANLRIHPYQHRRPLIELFDRFGVLSTVPGGFDLYERLGNKATFHTYLMDHGEESLCAPMRMIIHQGTQTESWVEEIRNIMEYSEGYPEALVSRLYIEKGEQILLEETSKTPWIQTMVLQDARGAGGMGTMVVSRNTCKTKWLVVPSDGGVQVTLHSFEDLISRISNLVEESTITATPYLITEVINDQEQSFSFCLTWQDDHVVIAGPHWQRLIDKSFDGFYYNGPSSEVSHVVIAKNFTLRFGLHLLKRGFSASFPVRAGIDFFYAILPNGERRLIAQDPNMRDTATVGLPMAALMRYGSELLNGDLVLSQSDHVAIPQHEKYLQLQGVLDRLRYCGVPLFGVGETATGIILQSIPKSHGKLIRLLVGYFAKNQADRSQLERDFARAFAE